MNLVRKIFKRDIKKILHNPVALVVTLGVCVLPSLYAWFNIAANWDPYQNTQDISVAVVNEDQGTTVPEQGYLNAGDLVHTELSHNTQLNWVFTDKNTALEGVKSGSYYAAIVIPSDFSATLSGVLSGDTTKAELEYFVNEKVNAVAPKVTDTGATTIENTINQKFVGTVSEVVATKAQKLAGAEAERLSKDTSELAQELRTSAADLGDAAQELDSTNSTLDKVKTALADAQTSLDTLGKGANSLSDTLDTSLNSLADTRSKTQSLSAQLSQALTDGANTVASISSEANYQVGALAGQVGWSTGKLTAATSELGAANQSVVSLRNSLQKTRDTLAALSLSMPQAQAQRDAVLAALDTRIAKLDAFIGSNQDKLDTLNKLAQNVQQGAQDASTLAQTLNSSLKTNADGLSALTVSLNTTTQAQVSATLDDFAQMGGTLSGKLSGLAPLLSQVKGDLGELSQLIDGAQDTITSTKDELTGAKDKLDALATDVSTIESTQLYGALSKALGDALTLDPQQVEAFFSAPTQLEEVALFPVANYGSGVAPFYTNLALWVGGFVLVSIYKLEVKNDSDTSAARPWQNFLARGALLCTFGLLQALICTVGDLVLGIQCTEPVLFVLAGLWTSFVYVSFIYAMAATFKHLGKALCVLLVVLQIPGASGMYPIQMMPGFFQTLYPWLPFHYGIDAMRECIAGLYGTSFALNMGVLSFMFVTSLALGLGLRRALLNLNAFFDQRLADSDFFIAETHIPQEPGLATSRYLQALAGAREQKSFVASQAARFEARYAVHIRRSLCALVVLPLVLLALMLVLPYKMVLLSLWVASILGICAYLIVLEYFHTRAHQLQQLARTQAANTAPVPHLDPAADPAPNQH